MAMQRDGPVHIGIDNQATVTAVNEIAEHQIQRKETKLVNDKGGFIIGGGTTRYHSVSKSKRPWSLVKNGDLNQSIEEGVIQKGTGNLKASKVKGHATEEMVEQGKVRRIDKEGNDISDEGADRGAERTNIKVVASGYVFSKRHKFYKILMQRILWFIIKIRKAEKAKRERKEKKDEPFREIGEKKKISIPIMMEFGNKEKGTERMEIRKVEYKDEKRGKRKKIIGTHQMFPKENNVAKDK